MMHLRNICSICYLLAVLVAFNSCAIRDDLPLPIKRAEITAFKVDGQCNELDTDTAAAVIDKEHRTVDVFVSDTVNIAALSIKRFEVSNEATIIPEQNTCLCPAKFPSTSFTRSAADDISSQVDFSKGAVTFTLRTYQDYKWTVNVKQVILRDIQIEGQVGDAIINPYDRLVIVYVAANKDRSALKVLQFSLGGKHGTVTPNPTQHTTYDFSKMRTFQVKMAGSRETQEWEVIVYKTTAAETVEATSFARSVSATISGKIPWGAQPVVEYHAAGTNQWTTVNESEVKVDKSRFTAELNGLRPATTYTYRVTAGNAKSEELTFATVGEQQLENAGFEEWNIVNPTSNKALYQPWGEGKAPYWGTGNPGATTVGASNSTYKDEDGRRFANLRSKFIAVKFAAGNIFTGEYLETDGTNGVLSFGRSFTSFPTKMRFDYKYKTSPITKTGGDWKEPWGKYISRSMYESMKGKPDTCSVYVALGDWEPQKYTYQFGAKAGQTIDVPYLIRTRPTALHLMNMNDPHLIAYGELSKGEDVPDSNLSSWVTETIDINYRVTDRQPKYIIVVASSSKYGDYFTGGEESLLQIDNVELLYE